MQLPAFKARLVQRIRWLGWGQWLALPVLPLLTLATQPWGRMFAAMLVFSVVLSLALFVALRAWQTSLRRQFIRESTVPRFLGDKLREQYPQLGVRDVELVLHGLRQFFMAHLRSQRQFVAMLSQVADAAWHEFILHTRA